MRCYTINFKRLTFSAVVLLSNCGHVQQVSDFSYKNLYQKQSQSKAGAVATAHPLATQAGVEMLEAGGNAVDAAVSAAFTLAVVEPSMSGIGGRTQILISSSSGEVFGIDGTTQAPLHYDYENAPKKRYGYPSIGVPGVVRGLTKALNEHGSLPLRKVMKPAISLAENGHALISGEALRQASVNKELNEFEGSRRYFLNEDGSAKKAGDWVVQTDLARVLNAIAEDGPDVFYEGWIAERIIEDNQANGGVLTRKALKDYRAENSYIVHGSYRGFDLVALYLPAFGAITIEVLHIIEALEEDMTDERIWGEALHNAIEAAYLDRKEQHSLEDAERLTSKAWARERADEISNGSLSPRSGGEPLPEAWSAPMGHTTHLTVVDRDGMVVALTQTLGTTLGSKVATPGLGFAYAQTLGGYLGEVRAGERASSHISPLLVSNNGSPFLALGAAGGSRIPSSIVAVISRIIDQGHDLASALRLPRVYPTEEGIDLEFTGGLGWSLADSLHFVELGYGVSVQRGIGRFGRIHAVMNDTVTGEWIGGADPDWEGSSAAPAQKR